MNKSGSNVAVAVNPFDRNHLRETKRSEIIRSAGEIFCSSGYAQTSVEDVANRIGISKAIIYYYFDNSLAYSYACETPSSSCL